METDATRARQLLRRRRGYTFINMQCIRRLRSARKIDFHRRAHRLLGKR